MIRVTKHLFVSALFTMIVIAACTGTAQAQGSRKDDIVFNAQGHPMAGAAVRVCTSGATGQPCAPLAQIYSDAALTQALANPTSTDGLGNYSFYAAPGRYMIEINGPGITTKQMPNVILPSDPSSPMFTSVTTTSGISAFSLSLTGNLTVNGSAAVLGSLTVGGAPVPSTNADNQWTAGQRFKGADPWRDFTAYMPAGGCGSTDDTTAYDLSTISAGSTTLTIDSWYPVDGSSLKYKNGCGVAVLHAGPTSTIAPPGAGCTISSIARVSNVVTITCAAPHGLPVGGWRESGLVVTGVTDTSFNGNFVLGWPNGATDTTHITYVQTASNASSSGGTVNALWGYAHGVTGSTTYNYKLVSIDGNMGYSAATSAITITNGNATLSATDLNYNWINVPPVLNSYMVAIYSDKGLGGAYSCVGVTFNMGYSDYGLQIPCPLFLPATPPATAGNQTLNTTIVSGSGTPTMTLAAAATNAITSEVTLHDESSFMQACVTDVNADQAGVGGISSSSYGCYIPASPGGSYWINGLLPTATQDANGIVKISVAGTLSFRTIPWFIGKGAYDIEGVGGGGNGLGPFFSKGGVYMAVGASVPAAFVLRGGVSHIVIKNFSIPYLLGYGVWAGDTWDAGGSVAGLTLDSLNIELGATAGGSPVWFDNNVIGVWMKDNTLVPRDAGGLPMTVFTMSDFGGNTICCINISNLTSNFHGMRFDGPAGNLTGGQINSITVDGWLSESLHDTFMVNHDNGDNAPGTGPVGAGIVLDHVGNADANQTGFIHQRYGSGGGHTNASFGVSLRDSSDGSIMSCGPDPSCDVPGVGYVSINSEDTNTVGSKGGGVGFSVNGSRAMLNSIPLILKAGKNQLTSGGIPAMQMLLPPAARFIAASTAGGSLSANTWCAVVYGEDSQVTTGYTDPSHEACATVGASSSITFTWDGDNSGSQVRGMYHGWRLYYGINSGNENKYYESSPGSFGSFTLTTNGGTSAALPTGTPNAYLSSLNWNGLSCLLCGSTAYPADATSGSLGIGIWPATGNGVKLDVGGGDFRTDHDLIAKSTTAYNGRFSAANITANHRWYSSNLDGTLGTFSDTSIAGWSATKCLKTGSIAGQISIDTVDCGGLATQYKQWLVCDGKGIGDGLNAVTAGTYLQTTCKNVTGVTVTITGIQCYTDNNGSSTLNAAGNTLGALLTGAITCTSSYATGTQSANISLTSNDYIKFTFVADGTSKQTDWVVTGTF